MSVFGNRERSGLVGDYDCTKLSSGSRQTPYNLSRFAPHDEAPRTA